MINSTKVDDLISAIKDGNISFLTSIKGIGKKAAERIVVELSEKDFDFKDVSFSPLNEAMEALINLGFSREDVYAVVKNITDKEDTESIIKQALKELGK